MESVSVIIPNYNGAGKLEPLFESLRAQDYPMDHMQICVGDDASQDSSITIMEQYREQGLNLHWAVSKKNRGRSAARNLALKLADGAIHIIIDNDFTLPSFFIREHVVTHEDAKNLVVIGPLLNVHSVTGFYQSFLDYYQKNENIYCESHSQSLPFMYFRANASIRKENIDILFDERFRLWGYEDVEMGYRLASRGLNFVYNRRAYVWHYLFEDSLEVRCRRNYDAGKNKALFAFIHPGSGQDLLGKKIRDNSFGTHFRYLARAAVCRFISVYGVGFEIKFLNTIYLLTSFSDKILPQKWTFSLYNAVAGIHLEVAFFRHLRALNSNRAEVE
ncbi:MAG TPA: glycosyltransferase [Candidatus Sumerlaeota bacterium]|nr:glycosyltransferase [Candidatus Sumerlaeota bacterium]